MTSVNIVLSIYGQNRSDTGSRPQTLLVILIVLDHNLYVTRQGYGKGGKVERVGVILCNNPASLPNILVYSLTGL